MFKILLTVGDTAIKASFCVHERKAKCPIREQTTKIKYLVGFRI
jgi:hypothetical protein